MTTALRAALRIGHRVGLADARMHMVDVTTTVHAPSDATFDAPLVLFMAVWAPGSYLVREYARHVEGVACLCDDAPRPAPKVRKNAWKIDATGARAVTFRYRLYANDLTVRTNHVDGSHAFLYGAATFVAVEGHEAVETVVTIDAPDGVRIATALPEVQPKRARPTFVAASFDELVDSPIEIGHHRERAFDVLGVPHRLVVHPPSAAKDDDLERIATHTRALIETEARMFDGALPYDRYLVQLHLSPRGRGGLEHRACCTLLANPHALDTRDAYLDLLSLIAHEVLHAWNVKRIRPAAFTPYRYDGESYTRMLWWFEGATSYLDWRVLRRANLCTPAEYIAHLEGEIAYLDGTHGRLVQSLEDASFDAWIKLYRPDENSSNSSVSYYRKGEVVCALLDLEIRARTSGRASLETVLRYLWEHYGKSETPIEEGALQAIFETATGAQLGDLFDAWIRAPGELAYTATLAHAGLALERHARPDAPRCSLGMKLRNDGARIVVASVARGGAAQRAHVDPGDEVLAIGGVRLDGAGVDGVLRGRAAGDRIELSLSRDGHVLHRQAFLDGPRLDRVRLVAKPDATAAERAVYKAWIGAPHPTTPNGLSTALAAAPPSHPAPPTSSATLREP